MFDSILFSRIFIVIKISLRFTISDNHWVIIMSYTELDFYRLLKNKTHTHTHMNSSEYFQSEFIAPELIWNSNFPKVCWKKQSVLVKMANILSKMILNFGFVGAPASFMSVVSTSTRSIQIWKLVSIVIKK